MTFSAGLINETLLQVQYPKEHIAYRAVESMVHILEGRLNIILDYTELI